MSNLSPAPGTPQTPTKAIVALIPGVLAVLYVLLDEGRDQLPPWLLLALSAVVAGLAVYAIPNKPKV